MSGLRRNWHDMSSSDFAEIDTDTSVVVLPIAAVEQHGPHLPLGVDAMINKGIVERALQRIPETLPVTVLPMVWVGKSNEHIDYAGTLTQSTATLTSAWCEIGESVARAGIRKLVLFNSHGGQIQIMQIVARQLRIDCEMLVASCSWFQLGLPDGLIDEAEMRYGIHAGEVETSMMLELHPNLVRMDRAGDFLPATLRNADGFPILMGLGAAGFGWQAQDLHVSGAAGNAAAATAEKGRAIIEHAADRFAQLLAEVSAYPLANLRTYPDIMG